MRVFVLSVCVRGTTQAHHHTGPVSLAGAALHSHRQIIIGEKLERVEVDIVLLKQWRVLRHLQSSQEVANGLLVMEPAKGQMYARPLQRREPKSKQAVFTQCPQNCQGLTVQRSSQNSVAVDIMCVQFTVCFKPMQLAHA